MHTLFKILGALLAVYALIAIHRGEVYARSGPWGKIIDRSTSPRYFWVVIFIYLGLAVSLILVF